MPVFVSSMDYRLWRFKSWVHALRYRLPWKRHALCCAIEREVVREQALYTLTPPYYIIRVKWARKLSNMSLVEAKHFVDRCYGDSKRQAPATPSAPERPRQGEG